MVNIPSPRALNVRSNSPLPTPSQCDNQNILTCQKSSLLGQYLPQLKTTLTDGNRGGIYWVMYMPQTFNCRTFIDYKLFSLCCLLTSSKPCNVGMIITNFIRMKLAQKSYRLCLRSSAGGKEKKKRVSSWTRTQVFWFQNWCFFFQNILSLQESQTSYFLPGHIFFKVSREILGRSRDWLSSSLQGSW